MAYPPPPYLQSLAELNEAFGLFFDPARIKPRHAACGPQGNLIQVMMPGT
jgi:hypothetical protein